MAIERQAINPWSWSADMEFNQAELVTGATRTLHIAGQTAMDPDGRPQHQHQRQLLDD